MDLTVISAIEQEAVKVKLSSGEFTVYPLTIRRTSKLAAMLKDVQGDPNKFKDANSPDFHKAVADALVAAGDNMPAALGLFTGDESLSKLADLSLLDLSAIVEAAAKVNKPAELLSSFRRAMEVFKGNAVQK